MLLLELIILSAWLFISRNTGSVLLQLSYDLLYVDLASGIVEVQPATRNATYGEQVQINCTTTSEEEAGVQWEFVRNGHNKRMRICAGSAIYYTVGGKYDCKNRINIHTLVINNVGLNDSGTYTCTEDEGRSLNRNSSRLIVSRK